MRARDRRTVTFDGSVRFSFHTVGRCAEGEGRKRKEFSDGWVVETMENVSVVAAEASGIRSIRTWLGESERAESARG